MERKYLKASEGYILTNGEIYGKKIYIADNLDANAFYEITQDEYNSIMENDASTDEDNAEINSALDGGEGTTEAE